MKGLVEFIEESLNEGLFGFGKKKKKAAGNSGSSSSSSNKGNDRDGFEFKDKEDLKEEFGPGSFWELNNGKYSKNGRKFEGIAVAIGGNFEKTCYDKKLDAYNLNRANWPREEGSVNEPFGIWATKPYDKKGFMYCLYYKNDWNSATKNWFKHNY